MLKNSIPQDSHLYILTSRIRFLPPKLNIFNFIDTKKVFAIFRSKQTSDYLVKLLKIKKKRQMQKLKDHLLVLLSQHKQWLLYLGKTFWEYLFFFFLCYVVIDISDKS